MKIIKGIFLAASFLVFAISCKKEKIIVTKTVTDSLLITYSTLTLYPTKDAAIFYSDNIDINDNYSDHGSGGSDFLQVGYHNYSDYFARTLIAFDVSALPADAKIFSATLSFTFGQSGGNGKEISVHKITENWFEGSTREIYCNYTSSCNQAGEPIIESEDVTWGYRHYPSDQWTTFGGSFVNTASASVPYGGLGTLSSQGMIDDVKSWSTSPATNFGWLLKTNEAGADRLGYELTNYLSREATTSGADATTQPKLVIVYYQ